MKLQKIFATALAVLMLGVATPGVSAETVVSPYTLALGAQGTALIVCLGPPEQEICEDNDIAPIGGYNGARTGSGSLSNVLVSIVDDNFENTYTEVCIYTNDHSLCGEDPGDVSAGGCGSVSIVGHPGITSDNPVAGFVFNVQVLDDASVCLGSTGMQAGAVLDYF